VESFANYLEKPLSLSGFFLMPFPTHLRERCSKRWSSRFRETPRVIDFDGRATELKRQAELILQKYPPNRREAASK